MTLANARQILHFIQNNTSNYFHYLCPTNKKRTKNMENNQPLLNEHNKTEHPPMHTCEFNTQLI